MRSLAAVFFVVIHALLASAPALAQQCAPRNILDEVKRNDAKEYARLRKEGRKIPNSRDIFWKVEKRGKAPSYLLGSMHVSDPRVLDIPAAARKAHRRSRVVVLESAEILDPMKAIALAFTKPDVMMMPAGKRIEDFLDGEQKQILSAALTRRGMPLSAVNYLRPWLITSAIAVPACEMARQNKGRKVLDQQLALDAVEYGIPVKGLETFDEQYGAMNSISLEAQVQALVESVTMAGQGGDIIETMIELYAARDLTLLTPMLKTYTPGEDTGTGGLPSEFDTAMIIRRNHIMAERARPFLNEGNAFIAVGTLHLQGKEGLVALLRKQGYKLSPIR